MSADVFVPDSAPGVVAIVATLAGLAVMLYRLGVWRQQMFDTKHHVSSEVSRLREESTRAFAGVHHRLDAIDRRLEIAAEQRVAAERWQARVETTLAGVGQRMDRLERVEVA